MIASLIGAKMATLHELSTIYSLEEARQMYEVLMVDHYNEWLSYRVSEQASQIRR